MFDNVITPLIDEYSSKLQPHLQTVGRRADAFGWHILARLDAIIENTSDPEEAEGRERIRRVLTNGVRLELGPIPMHQQWTLEVVNLSGAGRLVLDDGSGFLQGFTDGQSYEPGLTLPKGSLLGLTASADMTAYLQFTVKAPKGGKKAVTGFQNPDAEGTGPFSPVWRHTSPDVGHVPIVPSGDAPMGSTGV